MYSSATMSNSASGFREEELGAADDLGEGEGEESGASGEGECEDLDLGFLEGAGLAEGAGDASCIGFTGPVGLRGAEGGVTLGEGEGEGAPRTPKTPRPKARTKINKRSIMECPGGPAALPGAAEGKRFRRLP